MRAGAAWDTFLPGGPPLSFVEPEGSYLTADRWRLGIGLVAAAVGPAATGAALIGDKAFWPLLLPCSGFTLLFFLPAILWQLPRSRRPLATCLGVGMLSTSMPLALATLIVGLALEPGYALLGAVAGAAAAVPVGLAAGFLFWLSVVWRNPNAPDGEWQA